MAVAQFAVEQFVLFFKCSDLFFKHSDALFETALELRAALDVISIEAADSGHDRVNRE